MTRGSNPAKVKQWTERFERFSKSGQSVKQFCEAEGISGPSFYQWGRKLGRTTNGRQQKSHPSHRRTSRPAAFQPVRIAPPKHSSVTVRLRDGIVVELGNDPTTVAQVMDQLLDRLRAGDQAHGRQGSESC